MLIICYNMYSKSCFIQTSSSVCVQSAGDGGLGSSMKPTKKIIMEYSSIWYICSKNHPVTKLTNRNTLPKFNMEPENGTFEFFRCPIHQVETCELLRVLPFSTSSFQETNWLERFEAPERVTIGEFGYFFDFFGSKIDQGSILTPFFPKKKRWKIS